MLHDGHHQTVLIKSNENVNDVGGMVTELASFSVILFRYITVDLRACILVCQLSRAMILRFTSGSTLTQQHIDCNVIAGLLIVSLVIQ